MDNVLTVGGSARGEERSRQPQPQSGGLPEGAGGGTRNGAAANVAEALRGSESAAKNISTSPGPKLKKAKNKCASVYNRSFFIEVFRELSKHTPYIVPLGQFIHSTTSPMYTLLSRSLPIPVRPVYLSPPASDQSYPSP